MSDQPVIHWFRRDLRLSDNTALYAALSSGAPVVSVFVLDDLLLKSERLALPRLAFLLKGLAALDQSLRRRGSRLLVRRGTPWRIIPVLVDELGAAAVYANRDLSPYARRRDEVVEKALTVPFHLFDDVLIHAPDTVLKADGSSYTVYTPYKRTWLEQPKPPVSEMPPGRFHPVQDVDGQPDLSLRALGFAETIAVPEASELEAQRRLNVFIDRGIDTYAEARNRLVPNPYEDGPIGTSSLSPYLRLGMLSARQAYHTALDSRRYRRDDQIIKSHEVWISELIWRDFYGQILYHFPRVLTNYFRPEYEAVEFRSSQADIDAWKEGMTGYPVVDAAMRQLKTLGWMHNRARMIVASFLTKDLLIDWRVGELHFMQWLMDGDPAANNGGWQWAAGTGTDAQPYFRVFNPVSQSQKFDPNGEYIRHWVPELRDLPDQFIHTPWLAKEPRGYPRPIVDHGLARQRALDAFKAVKQSKS